MRVATVLMFLSMVTMRAAAETPAERLTHAKLSADLGDTAAAKVAFASLAADSGAPGSVRSEALVRLGVVERALGHRAASSAAFRKAMETPGRDASATRLLVLAVAGIAPDDGAWSADWSQVRLAANDAGQPPKVAWPRAARQRVADLIDVRDPVTFDLEEVPLTTFLFRLIAAGIDPNTEPDAARRLRAVPPGAPRVEGFPDSYEPPAVLKPMELLIHGAVQGRVTVKATNVPWSELLDSALASRGLGLVVDQGLIFIAPTSELGALDRVPHHTAKAHDMPTMIITGGPLTGAPGLLTNWPDRSMKFAIDPGVQGWANLVLVNRPGWQMLDLILAANGLAAARTAEPDTIRIAKASDLAGQIFDLTQLPSPPPPSGPPVHKVVAMRPSGGLVTTTWSAPLDANAARVQGDAAPLPVRPRPGVRGLSRDGRWLAFAMDTDDKARVFVRDLMTGAERRLPDELADEDGLCLSPDGRRVFYASTDDGTDVVRSAPAGGGASTIVCRECGLPNDVSPDARSLLLEQNFSTPSASVDLLDLGTGVRTKILADPKHAIYRTHFSPDGRWIAFHAGFPETTVQEFIAAFHGAQPIPRSEWIAVTDGQSDAPVWAPDGNTLYFLSDVDGARCVWARRVDAKTKQPQGEPFAVLHLHDPARALKDVPPWLIDLSVGADKLLYNTADALKN